MTTSRPFLPSTELAAMIHAKDFALYRLVGNQQAARRSADPAERARLATERADLVGRFEAVGRRIVDLTAW